MKTVRPKLRIILLTTWSKINNDAVKSHIDETTLLAAQQQIAQQAFAQIPDVVKRVRALVDFVRGSTPNHDRSSSYIFTKPSRRIILRKLLSHMKADGTV
jgi:hypothetical protein